MRYAEFKNDLEKGEEFSLYLFEGEERFFFEGGISLLTSRFVAEPALNLVNLGEGATPQEIARSLSLYPFMSQKRITVVKEFYPKASDLKGELGDLLQNSDASAVLAIFNTKPCDALKKFPSVCVVDCAKQDAGTLARWIKAECLESGVNIELENARLLAEYCAFDMSRIRNELDKLCAHSGYCGDITSADIERMVVKDVEHKIYEMTDYIGKKQFTKAFSVITDMLAKGETSQRVTTSVYNYFRRLLHCAISVKTDAELAVQLGVKEFAAKKTRAQAKLFKPKMLKSAVDMLTEVDFRTKSGLATADEQMWLSIFKIMTD